MNKKAELVETEETPMANVQPLAINPMQAAIQSGASPSELLQFMELQERWEANEARKAFNIAMSKFRAACPTIIKTEKGHNNAMHASIAGTLSQIKALMSENDLSHSWRTNQEGSNITVTCVVTHSQGHSEQTSLTGAPDKTGSKNDIQAIGSTVKYLERYTLEACLGLASSIDGDDDGQAAGQQVPRITEEQALTLTAKAEENGVYDAFVNWLNSQKVDSISNIRADRFDHVNKKLDVTIAARNKNAKD